MENNSHAHEKRVTSAQVIIQALPFASVFAGIHSKIEIGIVGNHIKLCLIAQRVVALCFIVISLCFVMIKNIAGYFLPKPQQNMSVSKYKRLK